MTRNMIIVIWLTVFLHPVIFPCVLHTAKEIEKMVGQEESAVARRADPEDRRKI